MAYVKFDKELAKAVKESLSSINGEISSTLNSISSSFSNKKVDLYSSFLKEYDENNVLISDFTDNARQYNNAAQNGSNKAKLLKNDISSKVNKVITALDKIINLVNKFENQTNVSIESETGDLSDSFAFLAKYGDASSLSALKGDGIFGNSSLEGIYGSDFDDSDTWNSDNYFLAQQGVATGAGIRNIIFRNLRSFLDENGNITIDGDNYGPLNKLNMGLLLKTGVGQKIKKEVVENVRELLSTNFIFDGISEEGISPFDEDKNNSNPLRYASVGLIGLFSGDMLRSDNDEGEGDKGDSRKKVKYFTDSLKCFVESGIAGENNGAFEEFLSHVDDNTTGDDFEEFLDRFGIDRDEMGDKTLEYIVVKDFSEAVTTTGFGLAEKVSDEVGMADKGLGEFTTDEKRLELAGKKFENGEMSIETSESALASLGAGIGNEFRNNSLDKVSKALEVSLKVGSGAAFDENSSGKAVDSIKEEMEQIKEDYAPEASQGPQNNEASQTSVHNNNEKPVQASQPKSESKPVQQTTPEPQQVKESQPPKNEPKVEVQQTVQTQNNSQPTTSGQSVKNSNTQLPDLPEIKKTDGISTSSSTFKSETSVDLSDLGNGKVKSSSAIIGAAGIGASAILGGKGNISIPTISDGGFTAPSVNSSSPVIGMDFPTSNQGITPNNVPNSGVGNAAINNNIPAANSNSAIMPNANNGKVMPSNATGNATVNATRSVTTHATASSTNPTGSLGKGNSSYGAPADAKSNNTTKAQVAESKTNAQQNEQQTKVEDLDKQLDAAAPEGVLGDASYIELIQKNEKEVKIGTGVAVSSFAVILTLKLTNVIGIVSFVLVLLAIVLVYTTFRIKKGKEHKKLESLIIIEKIKKEEKIKKDKIHDTNSNAIISIEKVGVNKENEATSSVDKEEVQENGVDVVEVDSSGVSKENVIYQEEIVYVDENGNVIDPPVEGAEIIHEEVVVEEQPEVKKIEIPKKKEFQSAEEIIYGQEPGDNSNN